ncbi:hypothetical protein BDV97DRAFT_279612, partial [Delphinella strobiligena]
SNITSLCFGTGENIYTSLQPALESVSQELIIVTCFWARSHTLDMLNMTLRTLSQKAVLSGTKIRIRICFSSSSLFQKLFHSWSADGQLYQPSSWPIKLGLPAASELPGLDMQVKSVFFLPFCVMHPKFIICDRKQVFLPSCNVSWEDWFEGCVGMSGEIVERFTNTGNDEVSSMDTATDLPATKSLSLIGVKTVFLPSPHHANPRFRFPWQDYSPPPPTPLNTFILRAISLARSSIYIQTPNLTSPPVLSAIMAALRNPELSVHIVTSARLMILEQLVTGGTTTAWCIRALLRRYRRLHVSLHDNADVEMAAPGVGGLKIEYYEPRKTLTNGPGSVGTTEPVQSHLKCMIVDQEIVVLGSGNLDRASWYTSQELGIGFCSKEFAETVGLTLEKVLVGRKKMVYD